MLRAGSSRDLQARQRSILEAERQIVLSGAWQPIAYTWDLALHGQYTSTEVVGEPVIVVRCTNGRLAAMSNVCRHRGHPVATGSGRGRILTCGYHGWTYTLDGVVQSAPGFEWEEVPECARKLPSFPVASAGPFIFSRIRTDGAWAPDVPAILHEMLRDEGYGKLSLVARREWRVAANWKLMVENFVECLHCPIVHAATLARAVDLKRYRVEERSGYSVHYISSLAPGSMARSESGPRRRHDTVERQTIVFFPNFAVSFLPGYIVTFVVTPSDSETCHVLRDVLAAESYATEETELAAADVVTYYESLMAEDIRVVEAAQRGVASRFYLPGPLSVVGERGVAHFRRQLQEALSIAEG